MAEAVEVLARCGELEVSEQVHSQLVSMSAATIDRRLAKDRKRFELKGRGATKPGTLLRSQIPIRTFADWDEDKAGFCECDLVGHDGGSLIGDFCQTLLLTCVKTAWIEPRGMAHQPSGPGPQASGNRADPDRFGCRGNGGNDFGQPR
jgi:hypothetical protein